MLQSDYAYAAPPHCCVIARSSSRRSPARPASPSRTPTASRPSSPRSSSTGTPRRSAPAAPRVHAGYRRRGQFVPALPRRQPDSGRHPGADAERARRRPRLGARDRRSRRRAQTEAARLARSDGVSHRTAAGHGRRDADHEGRHRDSSSSSRPRSPASRFPSRSCRSSSATTRARRKIPRDQHGRAVRAALAHPRDPGRQRHRHHRPVAAARRRPCWPADSIDSEPSHDPPRHAAAVPERRRARAARPTCSASASPRSKISSIAFPSATRTAATFQTIASLQARRGRVGRRRSPQLRHPADAAPALQDLRDARARSPPARCARSGSTSRSSRTSSTRISGSSCSASSS